MGFDGLELGVSMQRWGSNFTVSLLAYLALPKVGHKAMIVPIEMC